jgi:hypothetical protein
MKKLSLCAAGCALVLGSGAASAQVIDPGLSRDIGRAVGEAAVAAERAARQGYAESGGRYADRAGAFTEDAAIDACALAAEQQGHERGFRAVVRDIDGVERLPAGWNVDGVVEARRGWRDRAEAWGFRCSIRDGRVVNVDLGTEFARR